jgi:hypothetical protein
VGNNPTIYQSSLGFRFEHCTETITFREWIRIRREYNIAVGLIKDKLFFVGNKGIDLEKEINVYFSSCWAHHLYQYYLDAFIGALWVKIYYLHVYLEEKGDVLQI